MNIFYATCSVCGVERPLRTYCQRDVVGGETRTCRHCIQADVDEVAVQRLIAGQRPAYTTRAERQQAVQYLLSKRLTNAQIARRIGTTTRTVERLRARTTTHTEQRKSA